MEIVFFQGPRFLGGLRHIQKAESRLKMNHALKGLKLQKMTNTPSESGILSDLTVRMVEEKFGLTHITVHQILTNDLEMRKIRAKTVPKNLSQDQKDNRSDRCLDFSEQIENDPSYEAPELGMGHTSERTGKNRFTKTIATDHHVTRRSSKSY